MEQLIQIAEKVFISKFDSDWDKVRRYCIDHDACTSGMNVLEEALSKSGGSISVREMIEEVGDECFCWLIRQFLAGKDLGGANLLKAYLLGANLREADLREADLRGANLQIANLWSAKLEGGLTSWEPTSGELTSGKPTSGKLTSREQTSGKPT